MAPGKHGLNSRPPIKFKKRKTKPVIEGSADDVLHWEVSSLILANGGVDDPESVGVQSDTKALSFSRFDEVEVDIIELSSSGDGMGLVKEGNHVLIVPFTVPGDKVVARIYNISSTHSYAELVKVLQPSKARDDNLVNCRYFGKCSGCQLQMMTYKDQLEFKRKVILKAFQRQFVSNSGAIPEIDSTHPSPLVYGYRTKITPHFEIPRSRSKDVGGQHPQEIGFVEKGRRRILDIEECAIATGPLNVGLTEQRALAKAKLYKRGATILLREALSKTDSGSPGDSLKQYVTDPKQIIVERIGRFKFEFPAGSFFQNNNAILGDFTHYAYDQIITTFKELDLDDKQKFLVDAYCGSGLFSVACSEGFQSVIGVEISPDSVQFAIRNAKANNIANASFITGSADKIFEVVRTPPDHTALIIDPPRKGCDEAFLNQLLSFNPCVIIYVSCNVHTQARDIKFLMNQEKAGYKVTAIKGFDLFPQTQHVESIATLVRNQL